MIIIDRVSLRNFKKHKALDVSFDLGTNLIVGSNYAGKSTVLQAVGLALLGNSMCPGKSQHFITDGQKDFEIILSLSNGHQIKRTSKNSTVTDEDGKPVCRSHTAVNKYVEDLLGIDKKVFNKVYLSEQGSPQALLQMEGIELQRFIEACLGMDTLDVMVKKCENLSRDQSNISLGLSESVLSEAQIAGLKQQKGSFTTQKDVLSSKVKSLTVSGQQATIDVGEAEGIIEEQTNMHFAFNKYEATLTTLQEMLRDCKPFQHIEDTSDRELNLQDEQLLLTTQQRNKEKINKLQEQISVFQKTDTGLPFHQKIVQTFTDNFPKVPDCSKETSLRDSLKLEKRVLRETIRGLEDSLSSGVCPSCDRPFDGEEDHLAKAEKDLEHASEKNAKVTERLESAETAAEEAIKKVQLYFTAKNAADSSANQAIILGDAIKDSVHELEKIPQPLEVFTSGIMADSVEKAKLELEGAKLANRTADSFNRTRSSVELKIENLKAVPEPVGDLKELGKTLSDLRGVLAEAVEGLANTDRKLVQATSQLDAVQLSIEQHNNSQKKFKEATALGNNYKCIANVLRDIREKTVGTSLIQILSIADEFVSACTGGDVTAVNITDGGIYYTEGDIARPITSASGAQKSVIGLGLKMGLANIVPSNVSFMLLDEISADMDADVSSACMSILGRYTEQSMVVSHRPMDVADNVIEL